LRSSAFCYLLVLSIILAASGCDEDKERGCGKGTFTGHVTIADKSEPATYSGYSQITGNLTIACPNCAVVEDLRCLASVGGDLSITENGALTAVDLSRLTIVGGYLYVFDNPALETVSADRLAAVGNWFTIRENAALDSVSMTDLTTVGGDIVVAQNAALDSLTLPSLAHSGGVSLTSNAILESIEMGALAAVDGPLVISGSSQLESLEGLIELISVIDLLEIAQNSSLPYCEACAVIGQLAGFGGEISCFGNLEDACWTGSALDCSQL
jgi:hypothetical protein